MAAAVAEVLGAALRLSPLLGLTFNLPGGIPLPEAQQQLLAKEESEALVGQWYWIEMPLTCQSQVG